MHACVFCFALAALPPFSLRDVVLLRPVCALRHRRPRSAHRGLRTRRRQLGGGRLRPGVHQPPHRLERLPQVGDRRAPRPRRRRPDVRHDGVCRADPSPVGLPGVGAPREPGDVPADGPVPRPRVEAIAGRDDVRGARRTAHRAGAAAAAGTPHAGEPPGADGGVRGGGDRPRAPRRRWRCASATRGTTKSNKPT